ncbi:Zinc ion binding,transcription regulators, putative [Theobroma cacao]|uniref:Zinc ion binding,transcription regulators, putative n=1 Tax=Theobroma cacao TaxID=3641 RepID=A0A061DM61_THECC|nr:Zinc ion binding,transcription regulators, putative [Theobroma cacao]
MSCKCGSRSTFRDDVTGNLVCSECYTVLDFDNYDAQIGGINGPQGTNIHIGYAGTGSLFSYKDKKIFQAKTLIHEYTLNLNMSYSESDVTSMINEITEGQFGGGDWFNVLIGASCYVVMRRDNRFLPAAEVAEVVGCDVYELGRMIARVVKFLNLTLPEVSIAGLFERELNNSMRLANVDGEKKERMRKQGIFLVNCSVKWFLTTGRRPLPIVAAVMAFVAELNGVEGLKIEDVAKEVHATVATCKLRYKELLEALVKVAQVLPWGKDVTVKNVVKYAPFVIRYMEMKSMEEPGAVERGENFDLDDVVSECLRKVAEFGDDKDYIEGDSQYFDGRDRSEFPRIYNDNNIGNLKLSHECLSMIYTNFLNEVDDDRLEGQSGKVHGRKSRGLELHACKDWWSGKSELSKKLLLKQILEKEIGLDAMPPSFIAGCKANERRRKKINAAKVRINKIIDPSNSGSDGSGNFCSSEVVCAGKKRKRRQASEIDWEDFVIETLLLHQVKEEDIEKGHYKALLGLHVFNSGMK